MEIRTNISKKHVISQEEEAVLERAAKILDKLYANSQKSSIWEADFQRAKDSLVYLLDNLDFNGEYSYWDDVIDDSMTEQE